MLPVCPALTIVILCPLLYIELFEIYEKIPLFYCICTISTASSTISELVLWVFFASKYLVHMLSSLREEILV